MSKLLGFGLILTGMLIGGVGVPLSANSPGEPEQAPASIFTAWSGGTEGTKAAETGRGAAPALKPLSSNGTSALVAPADPKPAAAPSRGPHPALRPPAAPQARKPIVPAFETETIPADPALITRAVQTELARVGCYAGAVTGVWGPDTRRAMKTFTHRVNATLPVDKPDVILLSLLKAQIVPVCGKACPSGQLGAADGRCVPKAVLAQAARKSNPPAARAALGPTAATAKRQALVKGPAKPEAAAPASPPFVPVYEDAPRMALAGPMPAPGTGPTAGPAARETAIAPAPAAPSAAPEKRAEKAAPKHAHKRERRDAPAAKASYGQTRWAREFFRNSTTF